MKIGNWELRKPWVHYVDMPIEQEVYEEFRAHFGEQIAKEIEAIHSKCLSYEDCTCHKAAAVARGTK